MFRPKALSPDQAEDRRTKDFFDLILPGTIRFLSDHYIVGDSYRCVWAVREYPPTTEEQAILSQLADRCGVTLRIYHRLVDAAEQRKIIQNAARRNRLKSGDNDVNDSIEAQGNLQDVVELLANLRRNREPLLHCAVFIELKARNLEKLRQGGSGDHCGQCAGHPLWGLRPEQQRGRAALQGPGQPHRHVRFGQSQQKRPQSEPADD